MQQAQVITHGIEGALAERLRELALAQRFRLRETSQFAACQNLVRAAAPSVLVLRLGSHLDRELAFIEEVHACLPETAVLAIGAADNPVLAGLVWELGATFAVFPPTPAEAILDVITSLLSREAAA
jgi:DNA-binding NarL/FixJ family response regulator